MRDFITDLTKMHPMENLRFFVPMQPMRNILGAIYFTSSSDEWVIVECGISEERYRVADGHKITLVPLDSTYAHHHFYQSDLSSLMKQHPDRYRVSVLFPDDVH